MTPLTSTAAVAHPLLQANFHSCYKSQLGNWYIKGLDGWIYMVVTSSAYPEEVAVEALDELYELFQKAQRKWFQSKRTHETETCCTALLMKYGTLADGSAAQVLMSQVDQSVRLEYSASIRNLMNHVDELKEEMADNIQEALAKGEKLDRLEELSNECLEQAKLFKKRAKKLSWTMWLKDKRGVVVGTTLFTAAGAVAGFLIGGPAGAAVLTSMESVAAAQAIEASILASLFGGSFLGARSIAKTWFWNQKFLFLH
jgi:transcription termination factor NusB